MEYFNKGIFISSYTTDDGNGLDFYKNNILPIFIKQKNSLTNWDNRIKQSLILDPIVVGLFGEFDQCAISLL
ncbi:MAG: hypothetical protein IT265_14170, partial [Saprospiraceae bacterium]|nr:hypothetical protein [Saprospiraceae bacterium]